MGDTTTDVLIRRRGLFIDNDEVASSDDRWLDVADPARGRVWAQVPDASSADVDRAVKSARAAFDGEWSQWRAADRAAFLIRFGQAIAEHADDIAAVQVEENGKLTREMAGQARLMPEYFTYYAGLAQQPTGHTNPLHLTQMLNYTVREPVGVVAAITPWNSPLLLLAWKLGPALAAGCTVVAKPSEVTPVSTVDIAALAAECGLPPGVFNVVTGGGETGKALTTHPGVDKIAFTGSTGTGRAIAATAAHTLKRVSLELGGKSPNIVFADADLDQALNGLLAGIFGASGQTCMAGSRILVQEEVHDEVVSRLADRADQILVGDPADDASEMGTLANPEQYDKVRRHVELAQQEGATLEAGGMAAQVSGLSDGLFWRPTVFSGVTPEMTLAREEVFGPVAAVLRFRDEDDAVRLANDSEFGLAAGVWTGDVARAHRMAARLRAGTVWVNNYRKTGYSTPFGGYKQSGIGRENGPDALEEYTEVKSVWVDTGQGVKDPFNPRA